MDCISLLPDDFVLKILSLLPTKDVINTNVLSKRWRNLWKLVPKLEFFDIDNNADHGRFLRFVDRSLLLNVAPVLESLQFKLKRQCSDVDIGFWIRIAVDRGVRELDFNYSYMIDAPSKFPQSLYKCGTLVVLMLKNVSLVDVQFPVRFQLLKKLVLGNVIFLDSDTPEKLLSSCPVLEDLVLKRNVKDNVTRSFPIMVPSLQKFTYHAGADTQLAMNTPCLKYFETIDYGYMCFIEYLPEIVEARLQTICVNLDDMLRSLASVKRLLLCVPTESPYPIGSIFHQLTHLEFCTCETEWDLLMSMLQHSPKLRSLKLNEIHGNVLEGGISHWDEPSSVPGTLMFVLETFEWINYSGWEVERELATYILKHSRRLKIATFSPQANKVVKMGPCTTTLRDKYRMVTELARLPRGSPECELVFA